MDKYQDNETTSDDATPSKSINQFSVETMEQENDVIEQSPIEWPTSTCTNLQQMNEDCLMEIFSVKELDTMDLCSIAETCKRFRQVTQRIVPKDIDIRPDYDRRGYYDVEFKIYHQRTLNEVERIFRIFGKSLSAVGIGGPCSSTKVSNEDNFLLKLLTEHCNDDNIKSLTIRKIHFSDVLSFKLKPILRQLQRLNLWGLRVLTNTTIFANLDSLVDLSVSMVENSLAILENVFPKLERFEYGEFGEQINEQTFEKLCAFITRHKKLKKLHLDVSGNNSYRMIILQLIGNNSLELDHLKFFSAGANQRDHIGFNIQPLQTLKSLKTLFLRDVSFEDLQVFSSLTELRKLTLFFCKIPIDSTQFDVCTQLTKLVIIGSDQSIDVIGIISRLTNLKELRILYDFVLDEETFAKILSIVERRPNAFKLRCTIDFVSKKRYNNGRFRLYRWP